MVPIAIGYLKHNPSFYIIPLFLLCAFLVVNLYDWFYTPKIFINKDVDYLVRKARRFAIHHHKNRYDGKPYKVHLKIVFEFALKYRYLMDYNDYANFLAAAWLHDTIEDANQTYNDIRKNFNEPIAEMVYALTNEKGKSRHERANEKYYKGILQTPGASYIKICDRLANVKYSKKKKSSMFGLYRHEHNNFGEELYDLKYQPMFDELENMFGM